MTKLEKMAESYMIKQQDIALANQNHGPDLSVISYHAFAGFLAGFKAAREMAIELFNEHLESMGDEIIND